MCSAAILANLEYKLTQRIHSERSAGEFDGMRAMVDMSEQISCYPLALRHFSEGNSYPIQKIYV
jgi:hypothetical protein